MTRVARTSGALYGQSQVKKLRRRRCGGHLVDPHWIEIGDRFVWSALPPDHPEIGNAGWWHAAYCLNCAPLRPDGGIPS